MHLRLFSVRLIFFFFFNIFYVHSKNVAMSPEAGSPVVCKNGNPLIKFSFFMKWANLHGVSSGSVQVERENYVGVPKIVSRLTGTQHSSVNFLTLTPQGAKQNSALTA